MKVDQKIALNSVRKQRDKAARAKDAKSADNQNKIQTIAWSDEPYEAQKAAVVPSSNPCSTLLGFLGGTNMEPYVYVRLLHANRSKTGLADQTKCVSVINEQAVFRPEDANELLEDCKLTGKKYPDPSNLLVFLRVYDDDVGDDDCIGQAILSIKEVVEKPGSECFAAVAIYDEENGEMMCHCEMSACFTKDKDDVGTMSIKIFRLYDFREDIDADEGATACWYLLYFFVYILIGAALFKNLESEEWGCTLYFDAIWFMVITLTSVGYGDCFPETNGTKVLNFFVIVINILCIGWMFSVAVQQMIVMQERLERKLMGTIQNTMWAKDDENDAEKEVEVMSKNDDFRTTTIMCVVLITLTCIVYGLNSSETCMVETYSGGTLTNGTWTGGEWSQGGCSADPVWDGSDGTHAKDAAKCTARNTDDSGRCPQDGSDCCMDRTNAAGFMNFWDVLQFTVVTMATVGYGDVSPKTTWGKCYGMWFAMLGVAALARLGGLVVDSVMEKAHREKMEKILGQTLTSLDELDVFDADNDGRIDKFEFLMKMLVMTHECSQDTIDRIMGRFAQIDIDGDGDIDADDFLNMLKKKVLHEDPKDQQVAVQDA